MSEARRRAAIGIFTTTADLDAVMSRLHSQGIDRYVAFDIASPPHGAAQSSATPPLSPAMLGDLQARYPHAFVLRIDLTGGPKEEALVARTLLDSAAQSVQLHDL
tara:strand:+ start:1125 stop:1439 length:315 start_codon:yes stop_codon:yes gene_type:complete